MKRFALSMIGTAALALTLVGVPAQASPADSVQEAAASCGLAGHSKSLGETGFGLRASATTNSSGCKVTGKLERKSGSGWTHVKTQTKTADGSKNALFNFGCGNRAEYRLIVTTGGDNATIGSTGKVC
ncbi:hypothetical protein AB0I53_47610 [Saccharopolyspora sp. NPDC050389]|uniref:hypothetical protein n=1 Tax=Saccharopolyspora sp. NPDC050389 TaxID=3155516 RepID=UPI0033EF52B4